MNTNTALQLIAANPTMPFALTVIVMFGITMTVKAYTFRLAIEDAPAANRADIMREFGNMWSIRRRRR
ncbi:hypothetical protein [Streptomyces roseolus]|uniref:hypothetical protein n=2 Tax=Streptomyces TaxID=1883 RepID=UPI00365AC847